MNKNIQATFFVAADGNDKWSGKLSEPNAEKTDGPFATLLRARDAIREIKAKGDLKKAVTVMVRGGKYFFTETLGLDCIDSGTQDCPITYSAYPGEKPILSGGRKIEGWKPYKDRILKAEIPEAKGGNWKFRSLFLNDQRQIRARYPNFDPKNPLYGGWAFMEDYNSVDLQPHGPGYDTVAYKGRQKYGIITYKPGTFPRHWAKPQEAEVYMFVAEGFHNDVVPVKAVDETNRTITMTRRTRWGEDADPGAVHEPLVAPLASWWGEEMKTGGGPGARFRVENVLEELDQPGEWCLDSEEGVVYFWPPDNLLEKAEVVVPRLNRLVDLRGVSYLTISGFTLRHTNGGDNQHPPTGDGYGAMFPIAGLKYCGDVIRLHRSDHCIIENNNIDAPDGNGVYLEGYNLQNIVRGNEISYAGANSIALVGTKEGYPGNNRIADNYIHDGGYFDKYSAGVFLGLSGGNFVEHNLIEDLPQHAINLANNGYARNFVEYNEIRRVCREVVNGAINSWMEYSGPLNHTAQRSGHVIRYNRIADITWSLGHGGGGRKTDLEIGIYLDNYSSNCLVAGNILVGCPTGIVINQGSGNLIENNILAECDVPVYWEVGRTIPVRGNRLSRNILYFRKPARTLQDGGMSILRKGIPYYVYVGGISPDVIAESDYNLTFDTAGGEYPVSSNDGWPAAWDPKQPGQISFVEWRKLGYDAHTVFADPMFVDPEHGDYRLKPESPAFNLGFQPIDVSQIGIRKPRKSAGGE